MHQSLFEKSVSNYLDKNVGEEDLCFKHSGFSDSAKGDIEVSFKNIHRFKIKNPLNWYRDWQCLIVLQLGYDKE